MIEIETTYGHTLGVAHRTDGATLFISTSTSVDSLSPHMSSAQVDALADALPGDATTVEQVPNERGFFTYPLVRTTTGALLRAQESSAASGPHLWLFQGDGTTTADVLEQGVLDLDLDACSLLKSVLRTWHDDIPNRWGAADEE